MNSLKLNINIINNHYISFFIYFKYYKLYKYMIQQIKIQIIGKKKSPDDLSMSDDSLSAEINNKV